MLRSLSFLVLAGLFASCASTAPQKTPILEVSPKIEKAVDGIKGQKGKYVKLTSSSRGTYDVIDVLSGKPDIEFTGATLHVYCGGAYIQTDSFNDAMKMCRAIEADIVIVLGEPMKTN